MVDISFDEFKIGDLIIITGRKFPVEIIDIGKNIIEYIGPKGSKGLIIKEKGKIYNLRKTGKQLIKSIEVVGNAVFLPGNIKPGYKWKRW